MVRIEWTNVFSGTLRVKLLYGDAIIGEKKLAGVDVKDIEKYSQKLEKELREECQLQL
jgi:hypothetical protein